MAMYDYRVTFARYDEGATRVVREETLHLPDGTLFNRAHALANSLKQAGEDAVRVTFEGCTN